MVAGPRSLLLFTASGETPSRSTRHNEGHCRCRVRIADGSDEDIGEAKLIVGEVRHARKLNLVARKRRTSERCGCCEGGCRPPGILVQRVVAGICRSWGHVAVAARLFGNVE